MFSGLVMPWLDQGIHRTTPSKGMGPRVKPEDDKT